jgi:hypothetical protein
MAITLKTDTVTNKERTKQIIISTPTGEAPTITVFRELVWEDAGGNVIRKQDDKVITKLYPAIAGMTFPSITDGAGLYAFLSATADTWSQEP